MSIESQMAALSGATPGQKTDALIAEARKALREEHHKVLQFNPSVGREGELIDLISRLTDTLMALHRDRESAGFRDEILRHMRTCGILAQQSLRNGKTVPEWSAGGQPHIRMSPWGWSVGALNAAKRMIAEGEVVVVDGPPIEGYTYMIAGPNFPPEA